MFRCFYHLRFFRSLAKLTAIIACFLFYLFLLVFISFFPVKTAEKRLLVSRLTRIFTLSLVRVIGIRVKVIGGSRLGARKAKGYFFASNHLSYVDGFVLGSLFPVVYVSKSDLKKWPVIGLMSDFSGVLYVDRSRKNKISDHIEAMVDTLSAGANVLFFPEGTSSDGEELLPFKPAFFEAPLAAGAPIVPLTITYMSVDGESVSATNRDRIYWYADMTFAGHFFRLLSCSNIDVEVDIHPEIRLEAVEDSIALRKHACVLTYEAVLKGIDEGRRRRACRG